MMLKKRAVNFSILLCLIFLQNLVLASAHFNPYNFGPYKQTKALTKVASSRVLEELERLGVQVFEEQLIADDGTIYPRIKWQSDFHRRLSIELQDPIKADSIVEAYETHLKPALALEQQRESVQDWISQHAIFLGSHVHPGPEFLKDHALEKQLQWPGSDFESLWQPFFDHIQEDYMPPIYDQRATKARIMIITTSGGGGHFTVAEAMRASLKAHRHFKISFINNAKNQEKCDPLWLATHKYTGDRIYNEIFQQEHNLEKTALYWDMYGVLEDYIPSRCSRLLKEQIKIRQPHLIISTLQHMKLHIDLAYSLDTALRMTATDYQIADAIFPSIYRTSTQLVKYWIPCSDKEMFHGLCHYMSPNARGKQRREELLAYTNRQQEDKPQELLGGLFQVLGYPVRLAFSASELAPEQATSIKSRYGIAASEKVIVLSMGTQGVGSLQKLVREFNEQAEVFSQAVHVGVICGKNAKMKADIESYLSSKQQTSGRVSFNVLGYLSEEEMANYYKIADVLISKSGGATTAEASSLRLPTLICHSHPWEGCNRDFLMRNGLGWELNEDSPLIPQIIAFLQNQPKGACAFKPINWQDRLLDFLHAHFRLET